MRRGAATAAPLELLRPGSSKQLDEGAARKLKVRTVTDVYDARPQWLADAQAALDAAVAAAYGWEAHVAEEDALGALLGLNLAAGGGS